VLLVHGYGYHSGYFDELARRLNQEGVFCAAFDQVGHGYSDPEPGAPEGFVHVNSFDDWVEDVFAALTWAKSECGYSDLPTFLFGESMGGLQVLEAAMQSKFYGVSLAGVITTGAVLQVHPSVLPPKPIVKLLTFLAPYYPRLKMPNDSRLEAGYDGAFGDPEWARLTRADVRIMKAPKSTLAAAAAVLSTGPNVQGNAGSFPCPLFAIHAKGDTRVSIEPMKMFVDRLGPEKAQGLWVDSDGHQLLQDKREVTSTILDMVAGWIVEQAVAAAAYEKEK
jgi:alpha-beta hydrolase superfamily lysophospholipase